MSAWPSFATRASSRASSSLAVRRSLQLAARLGRKLFHAGEIVLGVRELLVTFVQLRNLGLHRPHHLVEAVGLDDGVIDGVFLAFERLRLVGDVLRERIE